MKKTVVFLTLLLMIFPLAAVSFSSSLIEAEGDVRFSRGFFPVNGKFSYTTDLPDYLDGISSSVVLSFDAGLKHRLLLQNPENGEHYDLSSSPFESESARWYQVHYVYFNLDYRMGLINTEYLKSPLFSLVFSLEGDYENEYERLGWLNTDGNEATFTVLDGGNRKERFSSYSGVLEFTKNTLTGYRQLSHTGVRLSAVFNYTEETRMTKDGLWGDVSVRYMPQWFPLHDSNGSSYFSLNAEGGLALTLLDISQFSIAGSDEALKMFTLVLDTSFDARFICGNGIPQYALERKLWNSHNANSSFLIGNTTKLIFRGPQLLEDVYTAFSLKNDVAYAFGNVANGDGTISCFSGSISLRGEADLFDTLYLYAECGWVYASVYAGDLGFKYSFGVRLGI